jgi:hypothetical protein
MRSNVQLARRRRNAIIAPAEVVMKLRRLFQQIVDKPTGLRKRRMDVAVFGLNTRER